MSVGTGGGRGRVWSTALCALPAGYVPGDPIGPALQLLRPAWRGWPWAPHTIADPFLLARGGRLYLFAEVQRPRRPGAIACWSSKDLATLEPHGTVLEADHHLSYPFVLDCGGETWMIPESAEAGEVALYRFADFPRGPEKVRTLLAGARVDSSVLVHDGLFYLFTSSAAGLEIFWSDDLAAGAFRPHRLNPVVADPARARCGGAPIRAGGRLFRLVQNGANRYGEGLSAWTITRLSPDEYRESLYCDDLLGTARGWNALGGHHMSVADFGGMKLAAIDGQAGEPLPAFLAKWPARALLRSLGAGQAAA